VIKDVMVVAFVPIVHNSGSYGEVEDLGLTPPDHGQTLGDNARAGTNYRVADRALGVAACYFRDKGL
jgi:D-mannonate dehydratase